LFFLRFFTDRGTLQKKPLVIKRALQKVAEIEGALLVDCMQALRSRPKHEILQHDGFHLSKIGQSIVGETIADAIVKHELNEAMAL
jgi:lysophospholipase L1-like esterase